MSNVAQNLKKYLLSGVSFAIPFVAAGGIMIASALAFSPMGPNGPDPSHSKVLSTMLNIGVAAFTLLVPILAGYIAYGMADRPGLVPGMVGGWIATHLGTKVTETVLITKDNFAALSDKLAGTVTVLHQNGQPVLQVTKTIDVSAGFLGGIVAGLLAGFVVMWLKKLKLPAFLRPIMPILVIPFLGSLAVGVVMYMIGVPIADLMTWLSAWLTKMGQGSAVTLALILGAMIAFDMGGPINKTAFFFGVAMIAEKNYAVMGACAAAICIPPIGMGLATLLVRKFWTDQEREAGIASLAMGMIGITEGAIPFAAGDPLRVIPTIMAGSMVGAVIAMVSGVGDHAPHGGPIVLPVVDHKLMFVVAIVAGSLTVAVISNVLRMISARKAAAKAQAEAGQPEKVLAQR
jgi:fructose-specific phosphotransferase system IIC component